jgi:phosphonopyruvate decarboxylase
MSVAGASDPDRLFGAALSAGFTAWSGVPCSILQPLLAAAGRHPDARYVPAGVEGEAVAFAAGVWLGGGRAAVLMQNSGLGNAVNPLASLAGPYRIPILLLISWRGQPGRPDAEHHLPMGRATPGILELLGIPAWTLGEDADPAGLVEAAETRMRETGRPAALLIPRGSFPPAGKLAGLGGGPGKAAAVRPSPLRFPGALLPSRMEVLAAYAGRYGDRPTIATTGYTCRQLSAVRDRDRFFYMQGSMGFALAIGLGLALTRPREPITVLDGDGALLMRLGSLATVGAQRPRNLVHLVLDNRAYASTGGQPTVAGSVDFPAAALACGYARAATCAGKEGLENALAWAFDGGDGPALLHLPISSAEPEGELSRPSLKPWEIGARFRAERTA